MDAPSNGFPNFVYSRTSFSSLQCAWYMALLTGWWWSASLNSAICQTLHVVPPIKFFLYGRLDEVQWAFCCSNSTNTTITKIQKCKNARYGCSLSVLWVFSEYVLWVFFECSLSVLWMWPLDWSCWISRDKPSLEIWWMYDAYMYGARKNIQACIINFL